MTETQTPLKQRLACGVGNVYNDLIRSMMYSFGLVYYMRVAQLSSNQSGVVLACGQFSSVIAGLVFGYCSDKVDLPYLSRRLGRRKVWHLLGTIIVAVSFMIAFSRCIICTWSPSSTVAFGYFTFAYGMVCFWYEAVAIGSLSIIPEIVKTYNETVTLNSIRQVYHNLEKRFGCKLNIEVTRVAVLVNLSISDLFVCLLLCFVFFLFNC